MSSRTRLLSVNGCFSFICRTVGSLLSDQGQSCVVALALLLAGIGCRSDMDQPAKRDINEVVTAHQSELMNLPEVVGVYVGAHGQKQTPCIKVMLARRTREIEQRIPRSLEGYQVVTEVTGPIRPMSGN